MYLGGRMKENLFNIRFIVARSRKSPDWNVSQVMNVCKTLKKSKAQDQNGMIYELFHPSYAGSDIFASLTSLYNGIKKTAAST